MANGALSVKQRRFANAYLGEARGNASEAARIAGYKDAGGESWDVLKSPNVRQYIDDRLAIETMSSAEVLAELTDIARAEWRDFITIKTNPKTGQQIDVKMDLTAKVKSLELLGKYHELWSDGKVTHRVVGADGGPVVVEHVSSDLERAREVFAILSEIGAFDAAGALHAADDPAVDAVYSARTDIASASVPLADG